ncbi:uncharacterized protein PRCAT00006340001 [Priceomyces carsonii]|uniref:uncharacterized protein n=1 Tax=Priceomyces carsonii TaxID=28549 RepID=UPI002ED77449|nr:unnamed protein product [Priceomyces carsonii]
MFNYTENSFESLRFIGTAIIGTIIINYLVNFLYNAYTARKLECKPMMLKQNDGFFGFKIFYQIWKAKAEGRMMEKLMERFELHPDVDTFNFRLAGFFLITTRDPENIKALLATQFNDFALGTRHSHFKPLLGDGIFTLDAEGWKHSRAMLRPQFAREQVAHVQTLEPHIKRLCKHILKHKGAEFDIQELFFKLTVDSATEFLFGQSVESLKDESIGENSEDLDFNGKKGFAHAFNTAQAYLATRALSQDLYFLINNAEFRNCNKAVHTFADYYVNLALNATQEELDNNSKGGYIFLYELVKQTRDPKVLRDQLLNILLAGRDTTAGLLSFTFFELARNPRIWEELKKEIYETFGYAENSKIDEITFESLKKCEYLKAVLNESLRMYPSVPQNYRVSTKATSLPRGGGKDGMSPIYIRKGQTITYTVYATHRNPKIYGKDAEVYRPERWFEQETRKLGWAFVPFNGGPRICLGQQFALTEASYVIVRLAQTFPNLSSNDSEYPPRKNSQLTMCLQDGANILMS